MARRRRPIGPLDLRAQAILRAVIEEYVTTATPVGSQALVERYGLGVSSATVRNILAELEANGLLTHPHTSAGRIPTDAGYRFFVESIVEAVPLPAVEQLMIRHQFGQVEFASEHWFRLAATTLASMTRAAGIATPAKPRDAHIRRIDLVAINERMASLILVLREGSIKQAVVTLDEDEAIDQPTLNPVAALLNERLVDLTATRAASRVDALHGRRRGSSDSPAGSASGSSGSSRNTTARRSRRSSATACSTSWRRQSSPRATSCGRSSRALENRAYLGELVGERCRGGPDPGLHRAREPAARDAGRVAGPRARMGGRVAPSASWVCSGRPGCPTPRRSARSASCPVSMNELVDHLYA